MPLNEEAEEQRATQVNNNFGHVSPGLVQNTTDLLFRDLWLRPGLAPRDRSLVTVSALIASGQVAQITYHLNRAMDNGEDPYEPPIEPDLECNTEDESCDESMTKVLAAIRHTQQGQTFTLLKRSGQCST
jgi:hypothetical protein